MFLLASGMLSLSCSLRINRGTNHMKNSIKLTLMAAFAGLALVAVTANANTITLGNVSAVPSGGGSDWTYSYTFANSTLNPGDYFTINDFGLAAVTLPPLGPLPTWAFSQALIGPNSLPATDDAGVLNVTFTWTGGTLIVPNGVFTFTLHSALGITATNHDYTSIDQSTSNPGTDSMAIGTVSGPATVPDGGSAVALLGIALAAVEGARRVLGSRKA
jgi:hypothetical protein